MDNLFTTTPTIGSHDHTVTNEELQVQVQRLEQQLRETQELLDSKKVKHQLSDKQKRRKKEKKEEKARKKWWEKAKDRFTTFIKPVLDFIPKFLNGLANLTKAKNKVKFA